MFFSGKSRSPFEALGLRGRQAAWRPGASVDERCGQLLRGTSEGAANMPQPAGVGLREGLRRRGISH